MKYPALVFFCCFSLYGNAQMDDEGEWAWGVKGGYAYSTMKDLINTVLPLSKRPIERPHSEELWIQGYTASIFSHKRIKNQPFVLVFEGSVSKLGGALATNITDTFYVNNKFKYTYAGGGAFIQWHPGLPDDVRANPSAFMGFHFGIGLNYGLILKDDITYASHRPQDDPGIARRMKGELKGQSSFNLLLGIGYEYYWEKSNFGLCFNARYNYGLRDAVQTLESTLYEETDVRSQSWLATLGFFVPLKR